VPVADEAHDDGQVLQKRLGGEVLVHGMRAGEETAEIVRADREHDGQADRRPERVFDATMNSVVAGSSVFNVSAMCAPSTFDT